jgi:corrinoid protein of di/trimethylamine methyltransferase
MAEQEPAQRKDWDSLFLALKHTVTNYDPEAASKTTKEALAAGVPPIRIVEEGLAQGLKQVGEQFGRHELFLPDLVMAAEAMKEALSVLEPEIKKTGAKRTTQGRVIMGTVEGDVHDIGKSIVAAVLSAGGFEVIDLGVDVKTSVFVEKVSKLKPDILGLSALLSTTVLKQREVAQALTDAHLRTSVKLVVGGAAVTKEWAEKIGADGFAKDAFEALNVLNKLLGR